VFNGCVAKADTIDKIHRSASRFDHLLFDKLAVWFDLISILRTFIVIFVRRAPIEPRLSRLNVQRFSPQSLRNLRSRRSSIARISVPRTPQPGTQHMLSADEASESSHST